MRISRRRPNYKTSQSKRHRINQYIRVPQVRLIDETGQNFGVVDTSAAIQMAQERGLDLVEVSPLAQPPVVKIVDYSKLKYEEEKERRKEKAKQKKIETKCIRLSLRISEHDIEVRVDRAEKFLSGGDKIKLDMLLRGREYQHMALAKEIINKFIDSVNKIVPVTIEQPLTVQGGRLSAVIAKK